MAGLKEILGRIKSVKNTKKITYAMKLVAATKMRGAQDAVLRSRSYSDAIKELLADVLSATDDTSLNHALLEKRDVKNVKLIIVGASKGLCGSYNSNVNKAIKSFFDNIDSNVNVKTVLLGKKLEEYFKRSKLPMTETHFDISDNPNEWPLDEICKKTEVEFENKEIDEAYVIYTKFKSAMSMTVETQQILPIDPKSLLNDMLAGADKKEATSQVIFEPSSEKVFESLLPKLIRVLVQQGALDSKASEHGSRMTAMDAATKNAGELIETLTLKYNKIRQAGITSEILDIVGGASAVE